MELRTKLLSRVETLEGALDKALKLREVIDPISHQVFELVDFVIPSSDKGRSMKEGSISIPIKKPVNSRFQSPKFLFFE